MGRGSPVSHVEKRQHRPLPQTQAFVGGNMPDHSALFLPSFVFYQHQGDVSLQDSTDEPGHSELQGRAEPEGQVLMLKGILRSPSWNSHLSFKNVVGDAAKVCPVRKGGDYSILLIFFPNGFH